MNWLNVGSKDELIELSKVDGKKNFIRMKRIIKSDLTKFIQNHGFEEKASLDMIQLTGRSWDGLYDRICIFRDMINGLEKEDNKICISYEIDYFKTEEDKMIFYIIEMDGKKRSANLGVTRKCFTDKDEARKWKNNMLKKIHPDKTNNKYATDAAAEVNQLYKEMVGND